MGTEETADDAELRRQLISALNGLTGLEDFEAWFWERSWQHSDGGWPDIAIVLSEWADDQSPIASERARRRLWEVLSEMSAPTTRQLLVGLWGAIAPPVGMTAAFLFIPDTTLNAATAPAERLAVEQGQGKGHVVVTV